MNQNAKPTPKRSITQVFQAILGRLVGVTTTTQMWLTDLRFQRSSSPRQLHNQQDTRTSKRQNTMKGLITKQSPTDQSEQVVSIFSMFENTFTRINQLWHLVSTI